MRQYGLIKKDRKGCNNKRCRICRTPVPTKGTARNRGKEELKRALRETRKEYESDSGMFDI